MAILFILIFLVSFIGFIIGLISPKAVIKWGVENKTRKNIFKYFGTALVVSFILVGVTIPKSEPKINEEESKTEEVLEPEQVVNTEDNTKVQNQNTVTTDNNIEKPVTNEDNTIINNTKTSTGSSSSSNSTTTNEPAQGNRTVYWVANGKSYHYRKDCPTLAKSKNILEGQASSCPKTDPCDKCVK